jgi:hypothetical protein
MRSVRSPNVSPCFLAIDLTIFETRTVSSIHN